MPIFEYPDFYGPSSGGIFKVKYVYKCLLLYIQEGWKEVSRYPPFHSFCVKTPDVPGPYVVR